MPISEEAGRRAFRLIEFTLLHLYFNTLRVHVCALADVVSIFGCFTLTAGLKGWHCSAQLGGSRSSEGLLFNQRAQAQAAVGSLSETPNP